MYVSTGTRTDRKNTQKTKNTKRNTDAQQTEEKPTENTKKYRKGNTSSSGYGQRQVRRALEKSAALASPRGGGRGGSFEDVALALVSLRFLRTFWYSGPFFVFFCVLFVFFVFFLFFLVFLVFFCVVSFFVLVVFFCFSGSFFVLM